MTTGAWSPSWGTHGQVDRRSLAHSSFDRLALRSLAAGLNRCSAPCGVIPPTASPISLQLAWWIRAFWAATWLRPSASLRR